MVVVVVLGGLCLSFSLILAPGHIEGDSLEIWNIIDDEGETHDLKNGKERHAAMCGDICFAIVIVMTK